MTFLKFPKMLPRQKSSDAPLPSMWHFWLADIFVCQSRFQISVFLPLRFSYVNHQPPPDISRPWEADPGEGRGGRRKRFYPNTISRLNLEFPVLNKMKVLTKARGEGCMGGWSGWVKYAPFPRLTVHQMLIVGPLWSHSGRPTVTPLTINQWITVGPIVVVVGAEYTVI